MHGGSVPAEKLSLNLDEPTSKVGDVHSLSCLERAQPETDKGRRLHEIGWRQLLDIVLIPSVDELCRTTETSTDKRGGDGHE